MGRSIKVSAPGSVANIGSGFDMMGFAVDGLGDYLTLSENVRSVLEILPIQGFEETISAIAEKNTAGAALLAMCKALDIQPGYTVRIEKRSPVGGGLGSSASSASAAVFALNELLGRPFLHKEDLLEFALQGEYVASGGFHADNVAPSLLGGLLAIRSIHPIDLVRIPVPPNFRVVLVYPHLEVLTKAARALIPPLVPINKVTEQMGNLAAFIMGMVRADTELIKRSFVDHLAEPYRSPLIMGYHAVKLAALANGAIGCNISGSGPTVFALAPSQESLEGIGLAMQEEFTKVGLRSDLFYSGVNCEGAVIL